MVPYSFDSTSSAAASLYHLCLINKKVYVSDLLFEHIKFSTSDEPIVCLLLFLFQMLFHVTSLQNSNKHFRVNFKLWNFYFIEPTLCNEDIGVSNLEFCWNEPFPRFNRQSVHPLPITYIRIHFHSFIHFSLYCFRIITFLS